MGERRSTCPFVALGIEHGADEATAKRAHRALMLGGAHPDRGGDPARAQELGGALQLIAEGKAFGRFACDCSGQRGRASADPFEGWDPFARYQPSAGFRRPRPRPPETDAERRARDEARAAADRQQRAYDERRAKAKADADRHRRERAERTRRPSANSWETRAREDEAHQKERDDIWDQVMRAHRERQAREAREAAEAESAERERRDERERARARQDRQNARPTSPPPWERPGKPIYQPGASRPSKAVRDLFERAKNEK